MSDRAHQSLQPGRFVPDPKVQKPGKSNECDSSGNLNDLDRPSTHDGVAIDGTPLLLPPLVHPNSIGDPQPQERIGHLHRKQRRYCSELGGAILRAPSIGPLTHTAISVHQPRKASDPEVPTQLHIRESLFMAPLTPYTEASQTIGDGIALPGLERESQPDDGSLRNLTHTASMVRGKVTHEADGAIQRVTMELRGAGRHTAVSQHRADEVPLSSLALHPEMSSGQWKRYAIAQTQSIGRLAFPRLSPHAPLRHPLLVKCGFDNATGHEPDSQHLSRDSLKPCIRSRGDEVTDRVIPRTLVRAVPVPASCPTSY